MDELYKSGTLQARKLWSRVSGHTQEEEVPTSQSIFPEMQEPGPNTFPAGPKDVFMWGTVPLFSMA